MNIELWLVLALFTKHFLIDFPLQFPRHYLNKGTYGHWGGIEHSALHGLGTAGVLSIFSLDPIWGLVDFLVHYHIDWAKMNINRYYGLKPDNSEKFWWLLGLDQYLHVITYVAIIYFVV